MPVKYMTEEIDFTIVSALLNTIEQKRLEKMFVMGKCSELLWFKSSMWYGNLKPLEKMGQLSQA